MKKSTSKKLVLSKQTVRNLAAEELRAVAGGTDEPPGCGNSVVVRCGTRPPVVKQA
jgi:hypothetical protein